MKNLTIASFTTLLAAVCICLGSAGMPAVTGEQQAANADAAAHADPPIRPRVIVFVNRNTSIAGYLEMDEADLIIISDLKGDLHTFTSSRILAMVRLVDPTPGGQPGTVYLRNGQQRDGIIHEDAFDYVIVEIEGIRSKLRRDVVSSVVLQPTLIERYHIFKNKMDPANIAQHLTLCAWLVDHKMWKQAQTELNELLEKEKPGEAIRLSRLVEAQLALMDAAAKTEANQTTDSAADPPQADAGESASDPASVNGSRRLLTEAEVNLIRVFELDFADPPRLNVKPEVIRQIISEYSSNPLIPAQAAQRNMMFRADPLKIVELMFQLKARHLYGQIDVLSEPASLQKFHRYVHDAWLIRNCATSGCHGGANAGRLQLHRDRSSSARVRYTNMLILDRLDLPGSERPLIDYDEPYMSLLIQHALPRNVARLPHPEVDGWRPVFTRGNKELMQKTVEWITSMMQPRPEYPIDFDPNEPPRARVPDIER